MKKKIPLIVATKYSKYLRFNLKINRPFRKKAGRLEKKRKTDNVFGWENQD